MNVKSVKSVMGKNAEKAQRVVVYVRDGVWAEQPETLGPVRRLWVQLIRFLSTTILGFLRHQCGLHAAGLTYFALMAFVPVLCLLMVFAKTCGADTFARDKINEQIDAAITRIEEGQQNSVEKTGGTSTQTEEEMLKLLGDMNVDLLVVDAQMFDDIKPAIAKIRQIRDLPIVLIISDKHALSLSELSDIGVTDFVTKPISSYVFQEVIHGILD